jgi:hypothetical protein
LGLLLNIPDDRASCWQHRPGSSINCVHVECRRIFPHISSLHSGEILLAIVCLWNRIFLQELVAGSRYYLFIFHKAQIFMTVYKKFHPLNCMLNTFRPNQTPKFASLRYILLISGALELLSFRRMVSSGMLRRVVLVRTDVSEELNAFFIRVPGTWYFFAACVGC